MRTNDLQGRRTQKSRFADTRDTAETLGIPAIELGQSEPRHYPPPEASAFPLGEAMTIGDVASIFGCSAWTVRHKYMRQGLPCLRTSRTGKFLFFRRQVLDWILKQQRKEEWK